MDYNEEVLNIYENDGMEEIFSVAEEDRPFNRVLKEKETESVTPAPMQFPPNKEKGVSNQVENKLDEEEGWRSTKDPKDFMGFLQEELHRIGNPRSWRTKSEKERGLAQLKKLDHFTSEALRSDYDNVLDVPSVDAIRNRVDQYIDQTEVALEGIQNMKTQRKKMRRRGEEDHDMVKEGGTPSFNGVSVVITPFQRAIVGAIINGKVSGGRDMEELYKEVKNKYDINPREELAIFQILSDMGYPNFKDRLRFGENEDPTREEGFGEWASNYYA